MFSLKLCVFAVVAFATYASADYISYCDCMKNTTYAQNKYGELYDSYFAEADDTIKNMRKELGKRLEVLKKKNPCNLSTNTNDYIFNLMTLCGGNRLSHTYEPFWRKDNKPAEEVCKFITLNLPSLTEQKKTMLRIINNCKYMDEFDKSVKTTIEGCGSC